MSEETEATIKKSILVPAILLVLILIFHAVAGIHWIRTDKAMRGLDELDYLMFLQRFESDIADPNLSLKQKVKIAFCPVFLSDWPRSHIRPLVAT